MKVSFLSGLGGVCVRVHTRECGRERRGIQLWICSVTFLENIHREVSSR